MESLALPWTVIIKNVPFVTIASILIIILGDTPLPKIIIVVLITFFPILANVTKGLKSADPVLLDRMQTLDSSQWEVFTKVRWPSALPYYIAAHEIAFTGSIIGAVVAEWLFARKGLGYLIVQSMSQYRADRVWGRNHSSQRARGRRLSSGQGDRKVSVPLAGPGPYLTKTRLGCLT